MTLMPKSAGGILPGKLAKMHDQRDFDRDYMKRMERYRAEKAKDARRVADETVVKRKYQSDLKIIERKLDESRKVLDKLYQGYNILPYYRNAVAIGYMKELLEIGVATQLEGPGQLYEKSRSDMRDDRVLERLNNISYRLDRIIDNQNRLYNQLESVKTKQSELTSRIEKEANAIRESNARIASRNADNMAALTYEAERSRKELEYQRYFLDNRL